MTRTLLDTYSIALEGASDLNRRILKENRELQAENSKLRKENIEAIADERVIKGLEDKVRELKADNVAYVNDFDKLIKENDKLKAEVKRLKGLLDMDSSLNDAIIKDAELIRELKAENKRLKKGFGHGVLVELEQVDSLKEEIDKLKHELKHKAIKVHQDRIPKEYKAEADEYFSHNPKSKGVRFHMIDFDEYGYEENDGLNGLMGTFSGELYADDCIVEIDNS